MIRNQLVVFCFFCNFLVAQNTSFSKAPNSYIYDIDLAYTNGYAGLEIPVKKAYDMWEQYEYLRIDSVANAIPEGLQSASIFWEDVPGLIQNVEVVSASQPSAAKIKVSVNNSAGKGNAVIAFKVNGTIYWSWHIWVTDNPENGVSYTQGFETDIEGNPITVQYMDRNLGAVSRSFLSNDWQKSGGLMYQWGRKDPFPPLMYKDANFYEISGEVGVLKHKQVDPQHTIPVELRPFSNIERNMQYSVHHPLTYILNTEDTGNWFSSSRYKEDGTSPDYIAWDLWSDNAKGKNSNASSSNEMLKNESRSYELKSELDPCPSGWRIPSYYGRETHNNNLSFFGRKNSGFNDDIIPKNNQISPTTLNTVLDGVKVYPGLGMDFTDAQNGDRNIGLIPVSGGYVYYPNAAAPDAAVGVVFQDDMANGAIWSSTFAYDGARVFSMISDPFRTTTSVGLHAIFINQTHPTRSGNAVRCIKDPNLGLIGNFPTEYFKANNVEFRDGLNNPNSYIVHQQNTVEIPVNKAFSVYNQLLSDHDNLETNALKAKVLWSTNPDLIRTVEIQSKGADQRNSVIKIDLVPGEIGNAVVSLHNGNINSPAYWSWHLWVTPEDPTAATVTYTTEKTLPFVDHFVNPTASKMPPLTTTFMDRNLGALSNNINSKLANGLHYQWGRKDPIPTFAFGSKVYIPGLITLNSILRPHHQVTAGYTEKAVDGNGFSYQFQPLDASEYLARFTKSYQIYGSKNPQQSIKTRENLAYAIQNPMTFLYQSGQGVLYNGGNHYSNNLTLIRDWADDLRAKAENRWGHAGEKSPFDPCPAGWRVPDVSFTHLYTGSKGNSPWYNGYGNDAYGKPGVIQDQWHQISDFYGGSEIEGRGWEFNNAMFPIGNFPKDGIRGELGENTITYERSGVWTAAMADLNTGYALAMQFEDGAMQTGTGVYPQAGMSVRCAKDESRFMYNNIIVEPTLNVSDEQYNNSVVKSDDLKIYPNPVKDEFSVTTSDLEVIEIYDLSGKLVLKAVAPIEKVNVRTLTAGIYIVKIMLKNQFTVAKKMIKY